MEIALAARSHPFQRLLLKSWYSKTVKNNSRKHSTVDVAHTIYGKIDGNTPIIILHGLLGSKKNWASMSKRLHEANQKTVIAVDARNHGESPHSPSHLYMDLAADIKRLMEKHKIKESIVMGHSMGGRTAMVLALTEPSRVSNLIVVDISPVTSPNVLNNFFPRLMDVMKSIKFDGMKDVATARALAKHKLTNSVLDMDDGMINFVAMNVGDRGGRIGWMCNIDALKSNFKSIASFPTEVAGKIYQGPTLFVNGEYSHFVPEGDYNAIKAIFPFLEMKYVEEAGHNVHAEKPDVFLSVVTQFISEYKL